jgi:hypothetical protein
MSIIKLSNNALSGLTSFTGSASLGDMVFISSATASSSASIDFTSGIDSTYKEYKFFFTDIHPATDQTFLTFQADTGTNTSYNQTVTTSYFTAYHNEAGSATALTYNTSYDLAQSTDFITIADRTGTDNDQCIVGMLTIFEPSSSTFVKHFVASTNCYEQSDYSSQVYVGGYFNTTTPITRFRFKMSSGNMDAGKILMFGLN